jgi:pyruvate dehydrogenase E2 component (dihydrolipoamide acetyltransferase)
MSVEILALPRLGETMEEGRIAGWLKRPGEAYKRGETILEVETDKTVVELPALADGTLVEILAGEGTTVTVGMPIARVETGLSDRHPGRSEAEARDPAPQAPAPAAAGSRITAGAVSGMTGEGTPPDRPRASPVARRLARNAGLDLAAIPGTGPRGRVTGDDIRRLRSGGIPWRGGTIALRRWGEADRTALLVHGFGGDAQTWATLAAGLARSGWSAAAPDLPSHGATDVEAATPADLVDALLAVLATIGRPVTLVGHSLGAWVAAEAAARTEVAGLVLLAPAGLGPKIGEDFLRGWLAARTAGALRHVLRLLSARAPMPSDAQLAALLDGIARHPGLAALADGIARDGRQQLDILAPLARVSAPVKVVLGLDDRIVDWRQAAGLPARVAVHLVADAGHMPHWDQTETVRALVEE